MNNGIQRLLFYKYFPFVAFLATVVLFVLSIFVLPTASIPFTYLLMTDTQIHETCSTFDAVLYDRINDLFEQHVTALHRDTIATQPVALNQMLHELATLPGVKNVHLLENGDKLTSVHPSLNRAWLKDSLRAILWNEDLYDIAGDGLVKHSVVFHSFRGENSTQFFLANGYTQEGRRINAAKDNKLTPSQVKYLIAVEFDSAWVLRSVRTLFENFVAHDMYFTQKIQPHAKLGFGIIDVKNEADTLWWHGSRDRDYFRFVSQIFEEKDWHGNNWFHAKVVSPIAGMRNSQEVNKVRGLIWVFTLIISFYMLCIGMFLFSIFQFRQLWLARETALDYLAHSLRTPISRIRIRGEILEQKRVESETEEQEMQRGIVDECDRLNRTVMNSLLIVRGEVKKSKLELCNLNDVIVETEQSWEPIFQNANIRFAVNQPEAATMGMFHRDLILVMMDNLLDNAFRAIVRRRQTENGDNRMKITLSLESIGTRQTRLVVEDTGIGFEPGKIMKSLKSKSLQTSLLNSDPGIGVGLRLVKEIVDRHNGKIIAANAPEGGARMEIILPLAMK